MVFDALVIGIALILAIKGFFNGVVREVAGLVGIIGGFYIASRYYHEAGEFINSNLITIPNKSAIDLVGFIGVFLLVWITCVFLGFLFNHLLKISALGFLDKLLGFLFGGLKFLLIISIIVASLYKIEFLKDKIDLIVKNSQTFPILVKIGDEIMKFNGEDLTKIQEGMKEKIENSIENNLKNVKIPINNLKDIKLPTNEKGD